MYTVEINRLTETYSIIDGDKLLYFSVELSLKCSNLQLFTADSHFLATKKFATKENDVSGDDDYASND